MVAASVVGIAIPPLHLSTTVGATSNQDPFVYAVEGYRHQNATWATNYDYGINVTVANDGTADYTDDNWCIHYTVYNSVNGTGIEGDSVLLSDDLPANLAVLHDYHNSDFWNYSTYWCCVKAELKLPDPNHDDDVSNDAKGSNQLNLATHPSFTVHNHVTAHNHRPATIQFTVGVPDLPSGWVVSFNRTSLEIATNQVGYVDISVTSPSVITTWPSFHVDFGGSTDHTADQYTTVWMRDDSVYATSCTEPVLL